MAKIVMQKPSKEEKDLCRIITPRFRVSYPHVFKAQAPQGGKPKYSITMLFAKNSDLKGHAPGADGGERSLIKVIKDAKLAYFGPKENWPKSIESPVMDGDDPKYADKDGYKGHWAIKAATGEDNRPSVVDADMSPITDPSALYPGCFARAYVYAYGWEYMGKFGVGFILDHVQKLGEGKSFGGKKSVEQIFSPMAAYAEEGDDDQDDEVDFK